MTQHDASRAPTGDIGDGARASGEDRAGASAPAVDPLLDMVMVPAWAGMIEWLLGQQWAIDQFTSDTGIAMPITRPRSALDAAIDAACGYDPDAAAKRFMAAFVRWATDTHWGSDGVTPGIAAALARLPDEVTA